MLTVCKFLTAFSLFILPSLSASGQGTTRVVAVTGETIPDSNQTFLGFPGFDFSGPTLNDSGQVAFLAGVADTADGSSDSRGIFRSNVIENTTQIVINGEAAPDGNGKFLFLGGPALNSTGEAAFVASLDRTTGGSTDDVGIFRGEGLTAPVQIARKGEAAPDGNGSFAVLDTPALDESGRATFFATLNGTIGGASDNSGIFRGDGLTSLVQIARAGQAAPGGNGTFSGFGGVNQPFFVVLAANAAGQTAFLADLHGTTGGGSDNNGIFRGDGAELNQIAREGQLSPDGNGTFSFFRSPALNDGGQAAFSASLVGTVGGGSDDWGIFRGDGTTLTQIARAGQVLPDGNGRFSGFVYDPDLNESGQAAFYGAITGTASGNDSRGIFRGDGESSPAQIAKAGQVAPDSNGFFADFASPSLNDTGQTAFLGVLSNTNRGLSDDVGIFMFDDALGLLQVAREGDDLMGSTIVHLTYNSSDRFSDDLIAIAQGSGLNNQGQVAYQFELADGREGIALWSPPTGLAGDYNNDGVVDSADYTSWRDNLGAPTGTLLNDPGSGVIGADQYGRWIANFGASVGEASITDAPVPEPATLALFGLCGMAFVSIRRLQAGR